MLFLLAAACAAMAVDAAVPPPKDDHIVAGYLPEWRYEGANFDVMARHLTHLILFSLEPGADGSIQARDRLPRPKIMKNARKWTRRHGTRLQMCFGGNGRSSGFSAMVASDRARARFVANVVALCDEHDLDGVDYNWEYPGYVMGGGYQAPAQVRKDYDGLLALIRETRAAFDARRPRPPVRRHVTMAYYPDGKQEAFLNAKGFAPYLDAMHSMAYDQTDKQWGNHHSSRAFARHVVQQAVESGLPPRKVTLGVPFYGRHARGWVSYEDLVQRGPGTRNPDRARLQPGDDVAPGDSGERVTFNGVATVANKTALAARHGMGIMIWEVGQDCRLEPVTRRGTTHVRTCPGAVDDRSASLLAAITSARLRGDPDALWAWEEATKGLSNRYKARKAAKKEAKKKGEL